jgi:hypothetical protein
MLYFAEIQTTYELNKQHTTPLRILNTVLRSELFPVYELVCTVHLTVLHLYYTNKRMLI